MDDFFGRYAADLQTMKNARAIDIGTGMGGPARYMQVSRCLPVGGCRTMHLHPAGLDRVCVCVPASPTPIDAAEEKGPQGRPQRRLDRRLEEVAKAVGGGYCRLQMPLRLALGVRGTGAGHRLGALKGGGRGPPMHPCPPPPPYLFFQQEQYGMQVTAIEYLHELVKICQIMNSLLQIPEERFNIIKGDFSHMDVDYMQLEGQFQCMTAQLTFLHIADKEDLFKRCTDRPHFSPPSPPAPGESRALHPSSLEPRDALEEKGPQRRPHRRFGRRLEEVAIAVGGGYCRLQMPLKLALGVGGTVAGHRLGALEGGGGGFPPFQCIPAQAPSLCPHLLFLLHVELGLKGDARAKCDSPSRSFDGAWPCCLADASEGTQGDTACFATAAWVPRLMVM